jgi:hypothetical protein
MDELQELRKLIESHKENHPNSRRYPDKFWRLAVKIAPDYGTQRLADDLGIHYGNLMRKIKKFAPQYVPRVGRPSRGQSKNKTQNQTFVQVPIKTSSSKQVTLELPHGITLRIEL